MLSLVKCLNEIESTDFSGMIQREIDMPCSLLVVNNNISALRKMQLERVGNNRLLYTVRPISLDPFHTVIINIGSRLLGHTIINSYVYNCIILRLS